MIDRRRFDEVTKFLGTGANRRSMIKGTAGAALAGVFALAGLQRTEAAQVSCNSKEKCEAKCGRESAECCNGTCVRGCGPNRTLHPRSCKCIRVTDGGSTKTGPFYCGA